MRPRNKRELYILECSKKLKPINKHQKKKAFNSVYPYSAVLKRKRKTDHKTIKCYHCGSIHEVEIDISKKYVCPDCKHDSFLMKSYKEKSSGYFTILDTYDDYQIIRTFYVQAYFSKDEKYSYSVNEVYQKWYKDKHETILAVDNACLHGYYDLWITSSPLSIKKDHIRYSSYYEIYHIMKLSSHVERAGYRDFITNAHRYQGINELDVIKLIHTENIVETLIKLKRYSLLKYFMSSYSQYKERIVRLLLRYNYEFPFEYVDTYNDYIIDCYNVYNDIFKKSILCPEDIIIAHNEARIKRQKLYEKRRIRLLKLNEEEEDRKQKQLENDKVDYNDTYQSRLKQFIGFNLIDNDIEVSFLDTVEDIYNEGKEMSHCIYANQYYRKNDSILFTSKKISENKKLESIEIKARNDGSVYLNQVLGHNNEITEYHNDITKLIENNIDTIKQLWQKTLSKTTI